MLNLKDQTPSTTTKRILLVGDVGSGKSWFASTAPQPILLFDTGSEFESYLGKDVDVIQLPADVQGYTMMKAAFNELKTRQPNKNLKMIDNLEKEYKTIVFDNCTGLNDLCMARAMAEAPERDPVGGPIWNVHYKMAAQLVEGAVRELLQLSGHKILLCHVTAEKDDVTGRVFFDPWIQGKMNPTKVPGYFSDVLYSVPLRGENGEMHYFVQTGASEKFKKCRIRTKALLGLPELIPNEWAYLVGDKNYEEIPEGSRWLPQARPKEKPKSGK